MNKKALGKVEKTAKKRAGVNTLCDSINADDAERFSFIRFFVFFLLSQ